MARKKQEVQLQTVIETQEEWEEMLSKEGLTIVDVYQEWAGPCKAMVSNFRRLKNELGDDLLRFAVGRSDTIESLEKYRGRCQPCFLVYGAKADNVDGLEKYRYTCKPCFLYFAGGILVAVVRGCNAPLLLKTITEQLAHEHKVLEGNAERKEIRDTEVDALSPKEEKEEEEEEEEEEPSMADIRSSGSDSQVPAAKKTEKEVTVALIRPDIVSEGKVDEVIARMESEGLEILAHEERQLTEEEAREFYSHSKDEEYFEGLVRLMTSGPSHVLVITKGEKGEGVISKWRELIGPPNVEEAKKQAPESLRAIFGKEGFANAIHGSDSHETAMKELAFFFPNFSTPKVGGKAGKPTQKSGIQRTLALVRPDAVKDPEVRDGLLAKIRESGFQIAMQKEVTITKEQAEDFYKEHRNEEYFDELTTRMSSGPLLALCLARDDAVQEWRSMLGPAKLDEAKEKAPESLRSQFSVEGVEINQIHGADSAEAAEKEIKYFFPMQQTLAVIKPDAYDKKDEIMEKIKSAGFHIAARKETTLTSDVVEQLYKDQKDKEYFGDLTKHMTSGPTLFMVLTGENAVEGWRSQMGPTDPSQAPDHTLRAHFGKDIKANALHGASTENAAKEAIKTVFGEIEIDAEGKLVTAKGKEEIKQQSRTATPTQGEDGAESRAAPPGENPSRPHSHTAHSPAVSRPVSSQPRSRRSSQGVLSPAITQPVSPREGVEGGSDDTTGDVEGKSGDEEGIQQEEDTVETKDFNDGLDSYAQDGNVEQDSSENEPLEKDESNEASTGEFIPDDNEVVEQQENATDVASSQRGSQHSLQQAPSGSQEHSPRGSQLSLQKSQNGSQHSLQPSVKGSQQSLKGSQQSVHQAPKGSQNSLQQSQKGSQQSVHTPNGSQHSVQQSPKGSQNSRQPSKKGSQQSLHTPTGSQHSVQQSPKGSQGSLKPSSKGQTSVQQSPKGSQGSVKRSLQGSQQSVQRSKGSQKSLQPSPKGSQQSLQPSLKGSQKSMQPSSKGSQQFSVNETEVKQSLASSSKGSVRSEAKNDESHNQGSQGTDQEPMASMNNEQDDNNVNGSSENLSQKGEAAARTQEQAETTQETTEEKPQETTETTQETSQETTQEPAQETTQETTEEQAEHGEQAKTTEPAAEQSTEPPATEAEPTGESETAGESDPSSEQAASAEGGQETTEESPAAEQTEQTEAPAAPETTEEEKPQSPAAAGTADETAQGEESKEESKEETQQESA